MAVTDAQRLAAWQANGGTGDLPAGYDVNGDMPNTPSTTSSGSSSDDATDLINTTIDNYNTQMQNYGNAITKYDQANPFNFDQMLATETQNASSALSPYYTQQLNDFMNGINIQSSESQAQTNMLVNESLADQDAYNQNAQGQLQTALLQAGQQFANAGSYDSGARARAQGVQQAQTAYGIQQQAIQSGYQRQQALYQNQQLQQVQIPYQTGVEQRQLAANQLQNAQSQGYSQAQNDQSQWTYNQQQAGIAATNGEFLGMNPTTWNSALSGILPGVSSGGSSPTTQGATS